MDKIGYGPSPDNEADLRRIYIRPRPSTQGPRQAGRLQPVRGSDPERVKADEADRWCRLSRLTRRPHAVTAWAEAKKHRFPGMSGAQPIHEVFLPFAQDIFFLVRGRGLWRIEHSKQRQPLKALAYPQKDGSTRLLYERLDEHDGAVELYVTPGDTAHVIFGDEHITKSENLPSVSEVVDARLHDADVDVNFRDLFGRTDSSSSTSSAGGSVKVSLESEQDVEGVASVQGSRRDRGSHRILRDRGKRDFPGAGGRGRHRHPRRKAGPDHGDTAAR